MKTLDRFILKSYLGPMFLTFFIVLFVLMLQFVWLYIDDLVGKGLTLDIIFEFIFWGTATFIPLAMPLSTMLASIMTMGNFGEYNELLAMKAAGLSVQRVMRPLMFLVIILSISAFFVSNNLIPYSNLQLKTLMNDIGKKRQEVKIPIGIFYDGVKDIILYAASEDEHTGLLHGIIVYDHRDNKGNTNVTLAESGYIRLTENKQHLIFTLFNGHSYEDDKPREASDTTAPFQRRMFSEQVILMSLEGYDFKRSNDEQFKEEARMLSLKELTPRIDSMKTVQTVYRENQSNTFKQGAGFALAYQFDSLMAQQRPYRINCDSLFQAMPLERQSNAAAMAIASVERMMMNVQSYAIEDNIKDMPLRRAEIERHRKFTLSFACLIFFFIGAPLGAIIRKGGLGMPVVVSCFFFVVYWVIDISGVKLARDGAVSPFIGTWISTFVLLPMGVFLTYKSTTDSALFNIDKYKNLLEFFKKKTKKASQSPPTEELNADDN